MSVLKEVLFSDSMSFDAFGRLRTSGITTEIDLKQVHDGLPLFIDTELIGSGNRVWNSEEASSTLSTTNAGDAAVCQTFQRFNYQTGKSQQILMTYERFAPQAGIIKRIGYFSSSSTSPFSAGLDGIFLESTEDGVFACICKNGTYIKRDLVPPVIRRFERSAIPINWNNSNILEIDFEWLGVGRTRFALIIDGLGYVISEHLHANNYEKIYMTNPNQNLRWEIRQTGATPGSFNFICSTVGSEGGINEIGKVLAIDDDLVSLSASSIGTSYTAMSIRLKAGAQGSFVDILNFVLFGSSNDSFLWRMVLNPTITGTLSFVDSPNSSIQYALGDGSQTSSGGIKIDSGYIEAGKSLTISSKNAIRLGKKINGVSDIVSIIVKPITSNLSVYRAMKWREQI